uniref:Uncharacterized protein n=1 Tax=Rousettus aegyptiacus TaxID=9407 RepID=A0A7J8FJ06_ROUAE|nr:hypothetical protein HJG63_011880 [Rousettus aegyptiacus]
MSGRSVLERRPKVVIQSQTMKTGRPGSSPGFSACLVRLLPGDMQGASPLRLLQEACRLCLAACVAHSLGVSVNRHCLFHLDWFEVPGTEWRLSEYKRGQVCSWGSYRLHLRTVYLQKRKTI